MDTFWLVQRLHHHARGVQHAPPGLLGNQFELDYMGSAEFEFDTPRQALRTMQRQRLGVIPREFTRKGRTRTVYFVANPVQLDRLWADFQQWAQEDMPRGKELSYFGDEFDGYNMFGPLPQEHWRRTQAWWAFDEGIAWSLDETVADDLWAVMTSGIRVC